MAPVPVSSQRFELCSWTQPYTHFQSSKLNVFLLVNVALPNPSLPSSQVSFWSQPEPLGLVTHKSPQAGTWASSSLSDAHTAFLPLGAGSITPGSILCPLEERGMFPASSVCRKTMWTPGWH